VGPVSEPGHPGVEGLGHLRHLGWDIPSMPLEPTRPSALGVETPSTLAWHTTLSRACSLRRPGARRESRYAPFRSLGISKVIVPARLSRRLSRWPLRLFTRSSVRSP
jgi:hypothetical protein